MLERELADASRRQTNSSEHTQYIYTYIYIGSNIYFDVVRDVCFCMIYDGIIDLNRGLDMDMVQQSSG